MEAASKIPTYCTVPGHEQEKIKYICLFLQCTFNRCLCGDCPLVDNHFSTHKEYIVQKKKLKSL